MPRTTTASWLALSQHEADAANGMNQPRAALDIDLPAQTRHLHVDHVVDRRRPARLLPDLPRQHVARHEVPVMPQQILEQFELANGQIERPIAAYRPARHEVELEIGGLQSKHL